MAHYRLLDRVPSVVITSNRNELKLYQGNLVYLNDGDNFELRFFNPLQEKLGVEIIFNGVKKGDSYLVLNPGQDLILDRFLDEQRKMLFETYSIDGNNQEALEAIEKNGLIKFNFYKEYHRNYSTQRDVNVNYNFPPKPHKPIKYKKSWTGSSGNIGVSGVSGTSGASGTCGMSGTSGASGTYGMSGSAGLPHFTNSRGISTSTSTSTTNVYYTDFSNSNNRIYTSSTFTSPGVSTTISDFSFSQDYWIPSTNSTTPVIDSLETGRIEAGEMSNQQLKVVNAQFASTPFHTVSYQILPYSAMNRTIAEVRTYCTECGYRLRKDNWKYCPKCGEKIQ